MSGKERARPVALGILERVERDGAYASILLQHLPPAMPPEEVRLATELVYGVLRHRLHDEHILSVLAGRPLARIEPRVALIFRMAAHQILRLDRVPDRAAVHEAVEMVRSTGGGSPRARAAAGFLNAVLRRLAREKGALPLPEIPDPSAGEAALARALSVVTSHPEWIVRRWLRRFGPEEARLLLEAANRRPPVSVRVDTGRASAEQVREAMGKEGIESEPAPFPPGFLRVTGGAVQRTSAFRRGWIYIQDEASGLVPLLVAPEPGWRLLDGCAAPGGKSLELARGTGPGGRVVAMDLHPARVRLLAENARRHGMGNILLLACDLTRPAVRGPFDAVLIDAPCTGTGVFRRDPESRYRLDPRSLEGLVNRQRLLLDTAADLVRPGGRLVYSVCSLEPEEGEEQAAAFLDRHGGYRREGLEGRLEGRVDLLGADGGLRTLPHRHDMDGFYAAAFLREPASSSARSPHKKKAAPKRCPSGGEPRKTSAKKPRKA